MIKNRRVAAAAAVLAAGGVVLFSMWISHVFQPVGTVKTRADVLDGTIERAIRDSNVAITDLSVRNAGGIVILRGIADPSSAQVAVDVVKRLGISRVANLIATPAAINDDAIRREAERQLAGTTALDGCTLHVNCEKGVLTVTGTVQHDLQRDAARVALRRIPGVREVKVDLSM
jgi:osmotically-inducible protein OsmY